MENIGVLQAGVNRGIQKKFLLFIAFLTIVFSFNLGYEFYALFRVSSLSRVISEEELPRSRGTQEAFRTMLNSRFAFGEALRLDKFSDFGEVSRLEQVFTSSSRVFDSYMAALTWGSESEAFLKSGGGSNLIEWQRLGLDEVLIMSPPSDNQMQLAGVVDIYFGGFYGNAFKALSEHKKFLNFQREGKNALAEESRDQSLVYFQKAGSFFELALGVLSDMAKGANDSAAANVKRIENTQRVVFANVFIVFIFGFVVSVAIIWLYAKKTKEMFEELDIAAKLLVRKDRELTSANLELQNRNNELNEMAKILVGRDLELSRSNERLMDVDELKSKFVSTAAHQLRTPLTAIKWSLNELMDGDFGKLKKDQEILIGDIVAANNRLISLVNDLLDVSRLEEGREIFDLKKQSIILLLQENFERFKKIASEKGVKILLDIPDSAPDLPCDGEKLGIAVSNLIDNAIKYTMPGGKVSVQMAVFEKEIIINVSDTGIGIPEDQVNRVFNRFFRAHNAMLLETYGSGLGLSVTKEIIEKHGGSLFFTSKEGEGSIFTISLPIV